MDSLEYPTRLFLLISTSSHTATVIIVAYKKRIQAKSLTPLQDSGKELNLVFENLRKEQILTEKYVCFNA